MFLSKLLLLFNICSVCKADNPHVRTWQTGTRVIVKAICCNPECGYKFSWCSQPYLEKTKIPVGDLLLSMATLFAGGSFSKICTIFKHMTVSYINHGSFFKFQNVSFCPITIYFIILFKINYSSIYNFRLFQMKSMVNKLFLNENLCL